MVRAGLRSGCSGVEDVGFRVESPLRMVCLALYDHLPLVMSPSPPHIGPIEYHCIHGGMLCVIMVRTLWRQ